MDLISPFLSPYIFSFGCTTWFLIEGRVGEAGMVQWVYGRVMGVSMVMMKLRNGGFEVISSLHSEV